MEENRWEHQEQAVRCFLREEKGILEMATGTGKTRTAIRIMKELFCQGAIDQAIVITMGNDLLAQWHRELLTHYKEAILFRWYGGYREFARFSLTGFPCKILLLSMIPEHMETVLRKMREKGSRTLLVFDEVHRAGAVMSRKKLVPYLDSYRFRLGLSATPFREYDEEGTEFLESSIGPVIFRFGLEDAIRKGILCRFRYLTLPYELTAEEKKKKQKIIAKYAKMREVQHVAEEDMYRELARVNKLASQKLSEFQKLLEVHPEILERCIIFVETREYGLGLQRILLRHTYRFHTYYGRDDSSNLIRFADGQIQCLITCKKISEGIDIHSVKHIVLFSSDRGKLQTMQRIGRSLRKEETNSDKTAVIVDFIYRGMVNEDTTADQERARWLTGLSASGKDGEHEAEPGITGCTDRRNREHEGNGRI